MKKKRRVVVTGIGVISPLGCDANTLFDNLLKGNSNFTTKNKFKRKYIGDFAKMSFIDSQYENIRKEFGIGSTHSFRNYVNTACKLALQDAEVEGKKDILGKMDLIIGTSESYSFRNINYMEYDFNRAATYVIGKRSASNLAKLASKLHIGGEVVLLPVACSGGNIALSLGTKRIKLGKTERCIVGSADQLGDSTYTTFYTLGALSKSSCQPFSAKRDGITPGEGSAFFVLEDLELALARNARIYAEITGYSALCDAYHATTPDPNGDVAKQSIMKALEKAQLSPKDISYISPHGTGTLTNDLQEINAFKEVFGNRAEKIPISAIKSISGHCMASSSSIEAIGAIMSILTGNIPDTINVSETDPKFLFKPYINGFKRKIISNVLSCSFGFGGNVSSVIISKYI